MQFGKYEIIDPAPATGILYRTNDFISGHLRMRGRNNGRYPYKYLEMIESVWGPDDRTIEVCSGWVDDTYFTIDLIQRYPKNFDSKPIDGQTLDGIPDNYFTRWRCDPPYNEKTAQEMYGIDLPNTSKLLEAGARVCKPCSLMFLLLGPQNYQWTPPNVKRIGWIAITIVPNNELRALHIYKKG